MSSWLQGPSFSETCANGARATKWLFFLQMTSLIKTHWLMYADNRIFLRNGLFDQTRSIVVKDGPHPHARIRVHCKLEFYTCPWVRMTIIIWWFTNATTMTEGVTIGCIWNEGRWDIAQWLVPGNSNEDGIGCLCRSIDGMRLDKNAQGLVFATITLDWQP